MMNLKTVNRFQASAAHLLVSGVVALLSAALVFLLWYPGLLSHASGVSSIFLMLLGVDVILGPLITLIVFNPKKKELKRDLLIVVLVQLAALLYGLQTVFIARPVYMVFSVDRFEVVYANDVSEDDLSKVNNPAYQSLPLFGPKTVAARLPTDSKERNDILFSAVVGGADVQQMPQYYVPYAELQGAAAQRVQPLTALHTLNPDKTALVDSLLAKYTAQKIEVGFVPLKAKVNDLTVVLDTKTGEVLEIVDLLPWK
jgi:hypothetical protein